MATLTAVIVPAKALKGDRHKIRISVSHNGETRYIVTSIVIDSAKEFRNGQVVKRPDAAMLNTKIRAELQKYQQAVDEISYIEGLTCSELVFNIKNAKTAKHRTMESIFQEFIETGRCTKSSKEIYTYQWNVISKYLPGTFFVDNLTLATINSIELSLKTRNVSKTMMYNYMNLLRMLVSFAIKNGYVQYRLNPFVGYTMPKKEVRDAWLTVDDVKAIRDVVTRSRTVATCRDMFMLSYYLGGINFVDLLKINFNEQAKTLHYERQKTQRIAKVNKYVEFDIPDEAKPIINKYKNHDGYIQLPKAQSTLPTSYMNNHMNKLQQEAGIKKHLIYYSARKSFSQHAFTLGVSTGVIDYILGHSLGKSGSTLYHYISVTPEMATKAIRQVLDNLK
jgi:site-specific recombinase XerD